MTTDSKEYKLCLLGQCAGKSALTIRLISGEFLDEFDPTLEDSYRKTVEIDNKAVLLDILDTGNYDDFHQMYDMWIKESKGFILVYSIAWISTFEVVKFIYEEIYRAKEDELDDIAIVLVGNMCDLNNRKISMTEGQKLAEKWKKNGIKCSFFKTSAKEKINNEEIFHECVRLLRKNGTSAKIQNENNEKKEKNNIFSKFGNVFKKKINDNNDIKHNEPKINDKENKQNNSKNKLSKFGKFKTKSKNDNKLENKESKTDEFDDKISIKQVLKLCNLDNIKNKKGVKLLKLFKSEGYQVLNDLYDLEFNDYIHTLNIKLKHSKILYNYVNNMQCSNNNNTKQALEEKIDNDDNSKYYIKSPYIVIIGISTYPSDNLTNLDGVKVDVNTMYNLFSKAYGYKYVFKCLDKLEYNDKSFKTKKSKLRLFLEYHRNNINTLNEINNNTIDSFMLFFSGHGQERGIITSDIKTFTFNEIHSIFNNSTIESLQGTVFLFSYDCCRSLSGNELDGKILSLNKGKNDINYINSLSDQFIWNATNDGYVAKEREDKNGSVFFNSINDIMLKNVKNNNYNKWSLQGEIATKVNKLVLNSCNGIQMPDPQNKLRNLVYFIPQN